MPYILLFIPAQDFAIPITSDVDLEDMVLVSRRLEDLNKILGLGAKVSSLGLDKMVLVFVFRQKYCSFQDLQVFWLIIQFFNNPD